MEELREQMDRRRNNVDFMKRLRDRIGEDETLLAKLADDERTARGRSMTPRIITVRSMNAQRQLEGHPWPAWPTDVPGLVVTPRVELDYSTCEFIPSSEYTITHEESGLTISRAAVGMFDDMCKLALRLAPLADWTGRPPKTVGIAVDGEVAEFNSGSPSTRGTES